MILNQVACFTFCASGQQSPEIGRWYAITNVGDSIIYEFTDEGMYSFFIVGGKPLVPLLEEHDTSVEPISKPTLRYKVDLSYVPHSIDFYYKNGEIFNKGIFEITPEGNMKICVDRFGVDRPDKFIPLDHQNDTQILIKINENGS